MFFNLFQILVLDVQFSELLVKGTFRRLSFSVFFGLFVGIVVCPFFNFLFGLFDFPDDLLDHNGMFSLDEIEQFFPDYDSIISNFLLTLFLFFLPIVSIFFIGFVVVHIRLLTLGLIFLIFQKEFHHLVFVCLFLLYF